jgi:single-strand DNA-binding protein
MFINKVMLYGNLTRDPELRALPSGMNVANLGLATNRVYKDKDGKKVEQAEFHTVVVFGKQADLVAQYLKKGSSAYIEGRLQTSSWDDKKTGEKKYRTEVVADTVQFGPRSSGGGGVPSSESSAQGEDMSSTAPSSTGIDYPKEDINPDDIPF